MEKKLIRRPTDPPIATPMLDKYLKLTDAMVLKVSALTCMVNALKKYNETCIKAALKLAEDLKECNSKPKPKPKPKPLLKK